MSTRIAGKRGRKPSPATPELHLRRFASQASPPPLKGDVSGGITEWGMLGNDQYGDCGPAATEHYRMAKAGSTSVSPAATNATTEALYFQYGRAMGEPGTQPDEGVDNATWLKWGYENGYWVGYARLDATNRAEVCAAMLNFSGVIIGCSLADDAEQEFENGQPWNISAQEQPDPNEGHDILLVSYDQDGETLVTWGALQKALIAWETGEAHAGDLEAWVMMSAEDAARNGVDLAALQAEIEAWGGEVKPTPAPGPAPSPSPSPSPAPAPAPAPSPAPSPDPNEIKRLFAKFAREVRAAAHALVEAIEAL